MAVWHNVIEENWKKYMECRGCGKVKELTTDNRWKDAGSKTWFLYRCKECMREVYQKHNVKFYYSHREEILQHHKEYRSLNKEKIRESRRNGREKENIKRRERMKEIVRNNREREKIKGYSPVHRKARYMIRKLWIRPRICPICWWEWKIDAHHPDYNKPYEIVFCCPSCHKLIHNWEICINSENIVLLNNK